MIGEPAEIDSHAAFRWRRSHCGLTLVEVLVVIAIIALLIGLLLPAVQSIRETARMAQCKNNLRMFGLAATNFETAYNAYPPSLTGIQGITFFGLMLPYMELDSFYLDRAHPTAAVHWRPGWPNGWWYDSLTTNQTRSNSAVFRTGIPQLPVLNCPARGVRTAETAPVPHGGWTKIRTCDYGVLSAGGVRDSHCRYPAANSIGMPPIRPGCIWHSTEDSGVAVLAIAKGGRRLRIEELSGTGYAASRLNEFGMVAGAFSNMAAAHHEYQGESGWPGIFRPYENWMSRVRPSDIVDGLSMTAMLAERHLSQWEIGRCCSSTGARSPAGARARGADERNFGTETPPFALDYDYMKPYLNFTVGGIARGPGDDAAIPTIGSWHPGECNFLMADGGVRTVSTDIADIMLRRLGDRRDQEILVVP